MKIEEVVRPGILALGVVGIAATALLGLAAGIAVSRDPEVLRRTARRVALGLEHATLIVAQAREHVGDLWADAREEAIAEVDAAAFERAASSATQAPPAAAAGTSAGTPPRKRASGPRKARRTMADRANSAANDAANDTAGQA